MCRGRKSGRACLEVACAGRLLVLRGSSPWGIGLYAVGGIGAGSDPEGDALALPLTPNGLILSSKCRL
eukprot:11263522-Alexandrium_andersonii.AAC.1